MEIFKRVAEKERDANTMRMIYRVIEWFQSEKKDEEIQQSGEKTSKV